MTPDDPIRSQFAALRASVPASDSDARERARARLEAHVECERDLLVAEIAERVQQQRVAVIRAQPAHGSSDEPRAALGIGAIHGVGEVVLGRAAAAAAAGVGAQRTPLLAAALAEQVRRDPVEPWTSRVPDRAVA